MFTGSTEDLQTHPALFACKLALEDVPFHRLMDRAWAGVVAYDAHMSGPEAFDPDFALDQLLIIIGAKLEMERRGITCSRVEGGAK